MKFNFKHIIAALAAVTLFIACNDDDNGNPVVAGKTGEAEIFFDNGISGNEFVLGIPYSNSNGEALTFSRLNYIISNVVLIDANGNEFVYPKGESYFIINQETGHFTVHLHQVPEGDYKHVRFGIGVDPERYLEGQDAQEDFWTLAIANNMAAIWQDGYRYINMEGTFTSAATTGAIPFSVYQMSSISPYNYREVTLTLPTTARVRQGEAPSIHIKTDVNVLLDGTNKIHLNDYLNDEGTHSLLSSGPSLLQLALNTTQMFVVDHVHNGSGHHD